MIWAYTDYKAKPIKNYLREAGAGSIFFTDILDAATSTIVPPLSPSKGPDALTTVTVSFGCFSVLLSTINGFEACSSVWSFSSLDSVLEGTVCSNLPTSLLAPETTT